MTTGKFEDTNVAIALLRQDVSFVKGTTEEIKGQLTNFIEKCDGKFSSFERQLTSNEVILDNIKDDVEVAHKRVDKLSDAISRSISNHERGCPSREATMQRLAKPSRPPKDTPRDIRRPDFINGSGNAIVPKWLVWIAASVGIGIAVFVFLYIKMTQNFGN